MMMMTDGDFMYSPSPPPFTCVQAHGRWLWRPVFGSLVFSHIVVAVAVAVVVAVVVVATGGGN